MFAAWTDRQVRGLLGPEALFHRLDGGGQAADGAVGRDGQAHLDGARRQRPLHRLRWERLFRALFCPAPARRVHTDVSTEFHPNAVARPPSGRVWREGRQSFLEGSLRPCEVFALRGLLVCVALRPPRVCCVAPARRRGPGQGGAGPPRPAAATPYGESLLQL